MSKREKFTNTIDADGDICMPMFNFYNSYRAIFDGLCMSEKGYLITWMMWYMFENTLPVGIVENNEADWRLLRIFKSMIPELDKQKQKYLEYLKTKQS